MLCIHLRITMPQPLLASAQQTVAAATLTQCSSSMVAMQVPDSTVQYSSKHGPSTEAHGSNAVSKGHSTEHSSCCCNSATMDSSVLLTSPRLAPSPCEGWEVIFRAVCPKAHCTVGAQALHHPYLNLSESLIIIV
jgi:hypothetical protein